MTTIGGINYQIGMDVSGFEAGGVMTRREMQLVRKEMRDSREPIEAVGERVDAVKRAFVNGASSEEEYQRAMARLIAESKRLEAELVDAEDATEHLTAAQREGRTLTQSLMTAEERRNAELARSRTLLARGHISQETHNRHLAQQRREMLQNVPVIGQMSSRFMGVHPAAIAAGAGIAILAAEMKVAIEIARWLTREVREQFVEIDRLAKSARALGIGTQDLIGLTEAADELAGVDFSGLEKSMQQLTRRVSEAATGSGQAADALAEIGLSATTLNDMSPAESFREIAGAIGDVSNSSDQARIAYDLFGRQGIALLPMLRAGREGIQAIEDQQRELGNTLSDLDTAAIERMNDTWNDSQDVVKGIVRTLAVDLAPVITAVAESLVEALKPGSQLGNDIRFALATIPPVIAMAADQTNLWLGGMQLIQTEALRMGATVVSALSSVDRATAIFDPFRSASEELQFIAEDLQRQLNVREAEALRRMGAGANGAMQARVKEIRDEIAAASRDNDAAPGNPNLEAEVAAAEAAASLRVEIDKLGVALTEQIATAGMSQDAMAVWRLEQQAAAAGTAEYSDAIAAIRQQQEQLAVVTRDAAATAAVDQLAASLNEQLKTIGMTSDQVARYKLEQSGALSLDVEMIAVTQQQVAIKQQRVDAEQQLADSIKQTTEALQFQIATTGMTAEAIEQYKLEQLGANKEQRDAIALLQAEAKARTQQQKLIDEGKQLAESLMTDEERKAAAIARATELRDAGTISEETYQRALAGTNDEMKRSIDLSQGIVGALKGSLEAELKLDAHARFLGGGRGDATPPSSGGFDPSAGAGEPLVIHPDFAAGGTGTVTPPPPPVTIHIPALATDDRLPDLLSRVLERLASIDTKTVPPSDDREPNEEEITIRVVN